MSSTELKFLGTTSSIPDVGDDSPSFLINGGYLFDTGWNVVENLRKTGCDIKGIRHLFFTHMHHDHYLSLPSLFFYLIHGQIYPIGQLTIAGPREDVGRVVKLACDFLQLEAFYPHILPPKVVGLEPGDRYEDGGMIFETERSDHAIPGLCYKITDTATGRVIGATGDTTYSPALPPFFSGCDVLIHETRLGTSKKDTPSSIACKHSNIYDAVRTASEAGVPKMFCVHAPLEKSEEITRLAATLWKGETVWPQRGRTYEI